MDKILSMQVFVQVVRAGSFTQAADKLDMSPQLVSKYVAYLETQLDTRLLHRTTRRISLTEAGSNYYARCQQVLDDIEQMESALSADQAHPSGLLRISAPVSFASRHLAPLLAEFHQTYPDIRVEVQMNDRKVDIVNEGFDLALRIGLLKSSSFIAKHIAPIHMVNCAAPAYLAKHGEPKCIEELAEHQWLQYSLLNSFDSDKAKTDGLLMPTATPIIRANNGDILQHAAEQGMGVVTQPTFIAGGALAEGRLTKILSGFEPPPLGLYVVYANRLYLPAKTRCFIKLIDGFFGDPPYWDNF